MNGVEPERVAERGKFVDKSLDALERWVVWPVGAPATDLIVADDRPPIGQLRHQRVVRASGNAGTAMQQHERYAASQSTGRPVPAPIAAE